MAFPNLHASMPKGGAIGDEDTLNDVDGMASFPLTKTEAFHALTTVPLLKIHDLAGIADAAAEYIDTVSPTSPSSDPRPSPEIEPPPIPPVPAPTPVSASVPAPRPSMTSAMKAIKKNVAEHTPGTPAHEEKKKAAPPVEASPKKPVQQQATLNSFFDIPVKPKPVEKPVVSAPSPTPAPKAKPKKAFSVKDFVDVEASVARKDEYEEEEEEAEEEEEVHKEKADTKESAKLKKRKKEHSKKKHKKKHKKEHKKDDKKKKRKKDESSSESSSSESDSTESDSSESDESSKKKRKKDDKPSKTKEEEPESKKRRLKKLVEPEEAEEVAAEEEEEEEEDEEDEEEESASEVEEATPLGDYPNPNVSDAEQSDSFQNCVKKYSKPRKEKAGAADETADTGKPKKRKRSSSRGAKSDANDEAPGFHRPPFLEHCIPQYPIDPAPNNPIVHFKDGIDGKLYSSAIHPVKAAYGDGVSRPHAQFINEFWAQITVADIHYAQLDQPEKQVIAVVFDANSKMIVIPKTKMEKIFQRYCAAQPGASKSSWTDLKKEYIKRGNWADGKPICPFPLFKEICKDCKDIIVAPPRAAPASAPVATSAAALTAVPRSVPAPVAASRAKSAPAAIASEDTVSVNADGHPARLAGKLLISASRACTDACEEVKRIARIVNDKNMAVVTTWVHDAFPGNQAPSLKVIDEMLRAFKKATEAPNATEADHATKMKNPMFLNLLWLKLDEWLKAHPEAIPEFKKRVAAIYPVPVEQNGKAVDAAAAAAAFAKKKKAAQEALKKLMEEEYQMKLAEKMKEFETPNTNYNYSDVDEEADKENKPPAKARPVAPVTKPSKKARDAELVD